MFLFYHQLRIYKEKLQTQICAVVEIIENGIQSTKIARI